MDYYITLSIHSSLVDPELYGKTYIHSKLFLSCGHGDVTSKPSTKTNTEFFNFLRYTAEYYHENMPLFMF